MERTQQARTGPAVAPAAAPAPVAVGPVAPMPVTARPMLVIRRMTDGEAVPLRTRRGALFDRLTAAGDSIPDSFPSGGTQHPALARLDTMRDTLQNAAAADRDATATQLDEIDREVTSYETFLADRAEVLGDLHRLFSTYATSRADDPALLTGAVGNLSAGKVGKKRAEVAKDLRLGRGAPLELADLRRAVEATVMPGNKAMQSLRGSNAGDATRVIGKLVEAGMVMPDTLDDMWKAPGHDDGIDQFGAKWSMRTADIHSGAAQWIREWEYHIHASAERARPYDPDDPAPNPVTGFRIKRGHIKPTAKKMALGVSIQVDDATFVDAAKSPDSIAKFCRWGNGAGAKDLARKK